MWRDDAKATRANVAKRMDAAEEALESAVSLLVNMPKDGKVAGDLRNALGWIGSGRLRMEKNKGKRSK